jgi:hypothetical protein
MLQDKQAHQIRIFYIQSYLSSQKWIKFLRTRWATVVLPQQSV